MSLRRETRTTLPAEPLFGIEPNSPAYETGASPKHASRAKWLFEDPTRVVDNGAMGIYSMSTCLQINRPTNSSEHHARIGLAYLVWKTSAQPLGQWCGLLGF